MGDLESARRQALAAVLAERGLDAALITRAVNVRYLTGLISSNAALLVRPGGPALLATDGRYAGKAARICPELELVVRRGTAQTLAARAAGLDAATLAFEEHAVTVAAHGELGKAFGRPGLVPLGGAVEDLRMVKDETEIDLLRTACAITDAAFERILPALRPGVTEREIAIALERHMVDLGAEGAAFGSIVAAGPNGAIPHHDPGDRPLAAGDLVTLDFGARHRGYHADMTRTVAVGRAAQWQREVYDLVRLAQRAGAEAALAGADVRAVDAAARDVVEAAGHGPDFPHGLGHGVGLEIHEAPMLGYQRTGKLKAGVPLTAEPGVYLGGRGGVRIEDTLVVRADRPEILTQTTKDLLVLP